MYHFSTSYSKKTIFFLIPIFLILCGCLSTEKEASVPTDLVSEALIPLPQQVEAAHGSFNLDEDLTINVSEELPSVLAIATNLKQLFTARTAGEVTVRTAPVSDDNGIYLSLSNDSGQGEEGYELLIDEERVVLTAYKPAGLFYGLETIRQLLELNPGRKFLPTGTINDKPVYAYRGVMLDVARHFFPVTSVKRYIDYLALYKMNYLHLHLSDDQGWRIEIDSWPNLTEHGGSMEVGGGKGGFYTKEEYKEIVRYAAERYITIVPEIDMPGHTNAALASYPELNCDGKAPELFTGTDVGFSTLCTDMELTYKFIDDVFGELADITPGPYIHIGGDESHATPIEDYIPFVNRVQAIVNDHGKIAIGWDEIANATLQEGNIAQFWAKSENALKAVDQGAKILMSPANKAYLDMKYDSTTRLGLHWAGYVPVDSAYMWSPSTLVDGIKKANILGVEAPLWSETVTNLDELEYMVFPRLPGYAEIGWTPAEKRDWDTYRKRLAAHSKIFDKMEIDYFHSTKVDWPVGK